MKTQADLIIAQNNLEQQSYESNLKLALKLYFDARPQISRIGHTKDMFSAGFKMAWNLFKNEKPKYGMYHCNKHQGHGFISDCIECHKEALL